MSSNREEDEQGLNGDLLLALLTGKCPHEIQLTRVMAILGALTMRQPGGTVTVSHEEMLALAERPLKVESTPAGIEVTVIDRPSEADVKQPTHAAPPGRQ